MGEVKRVVRFKRNIQKPFIIRVSAAHGFPTINRLLFFEALGFVFVSVLNWTQEGVLQVFHKSV